jgi:hypothetical protein
MNNPFDLSTYKPQINMKDSERSRKSSYQMSRYVNEQRKKGVELFSSCASRADAYAGGVPKDYATDMPVMPLHERTIAKKRREAK